MTCICIKCVCVILCFVLRLRMKYISSIHVLFPSADVDSGSMTAGEWFPDQASQPALRNLQLLQWPFWRLAWTSVTIICSIFDWNKCTHKHTCCLCVQNTVLHTDTVNSMKMISLHHQNDIMYGKIRKVNFWIYKVDPRRGNFPRHGLLNFVTHWTAQYSLLLWQGT